MIQSKIDMLKKIAIQLHDDGLRDSASFKMVAFEISELFLLIDEKKKAEFWRGETK